MPSRDRLDRLLAFSRAPAPNDDSSAVKTNLPNSTVQLLQDILAHHIAHRPDSDVFGHGQAKNLKLVEAFVRPRAQDQNATGSNPTRQVPEGKPDADGLEAVTVCEIPVEKDMLNVHGTLAGACTTLLIDLGTFSALFALGVVVGVDPTGFSASMNVVWHAPAVRGATLRLVNTSLALKPRMASARCEIYDQDGKLLVSATQIVSPIQGLRGAGTTANAARQAVAVRSDRGVDGKAKL
ncbi:hypothetical protein C8Q77DRAFT_273489 [Trametes polyzona]|nr:hypothetical protein C8Q77DRAFT_273489 [Trametes polyzona]